MFFPRRLGGKTHTTLLTLQMLAFRVMNVANMQRKLRTRIGHKVTKATFERLTFSLMFHLKSLTNEWMTLRPFLLLIIRNICRSFTLAVAPKCKASLLILLNFIRCRSWGCPIPRTSTKACPTLSDFFLDPLPPPMAFLKGTSDGEATWQVSFFTNEATTEAVVKLFLVLSSFWSCSLFLASCTLSWSLLKTDNSGNYNEIVHNALHTTFFEVWQNSKVEGSAYWQSCLC